MRRNEIVDLSARLFAANGYAATGIREIGDAAELARGALYYYIDSKESLLGEIHDRVMDPLLSQTRNIVELAASATTRLRLISEVLLTQIIGHQRSRVGVSARIPLANRGKTDHVQAKTRRVRESPY